MKKILIGYLTEDLNNGINNYIKTFLDEIKDQNVQIDFLTKSKDKESVLQNYIKQKGYNKLHYISRNRRPIKQLIEMVKIIKENKYDIAYFNISETYNCIGLIAAKLCKIKKVIVHSHSSGCECTQKIMIHIKEAINTICKPIVESCANSYLTCSKYAAKWMYTNNIVKNNKYEIINNVVDYDKFKYDANKRNELRKKLNIEDKFVIGHIGRFSFSKNNKFVIDIFSKVLEKKTNAYLICIGDGEDFEEIKEYSKKIGIFDKILFTGAVNGTYDYLQTFDIFILPSRFEGLPIVGIEAQFSGLPFLYSDTITDEVNIGKNSKKLTIKEIDSWVNEILKCNNRENPLLDNSIKFFKKNSREQFLKIIDDDHIIKKEKRITLNLLFKVIMVVHFVLNLTCFYNGFNYLVIPTFIILIFIFIKNIKNYKLFIKDKINILLAGYILSYCITFSFTSQYNIIGSIKTLIWTIYHIIFVFMYLHISSNNQFKFEFNTVFSLLLIILTAINIDNIILLFTNTFKVITSFGNEELIIGTTPWGRFYGIFYDANYASIVSTTCVLYGLYLFKNNKKVIFKISICLSIIINLLYIIFCQSRSGLLSLIIGINVYYIIHLIITNKVKKEKIFKLITGILLITITLIASSKILISGFNIFKEYRSSLLKDKEKEHYEIKIGRNDSEQDISNRRFDIWKSGLEIFKENFILGVGFSNLTEIALDKYPDTYIVNNDFSIFNAMHNVIIDVTVSQGLIGLFTILGIAFYTIYLTVKKWKDMFKSKNKEIIILLISIIISILASSMFLSEIFYINNACTYVFWLSFGYYNYFLNKKEV